MAKRQMSELERLEARYNELSRNLQTYRKQYLQLQEQYPPESEYLTQQLKNLASLLALNKSEILEVTVRIKALKEERAKSKKKGKFLRLVG